jgi:hypothetical protein
VQLAPIIQEKERKKKKALSLSLSDPLARCKEKRGGEIDRSMGKN